MVIKVAYCLYRYFACTQSILHKWLRLIFFFEVQVFTVLRGGAAVLPWVVFQAVLLWGLRGAELVGLGLGG